jgi:hypothetical protein
MTKNPLQSLIGKPVIVRANVAGVHCGVLAGIDPATQTAVLKDAYRLWRVNTRDTTGSISDIAANGLKPPLSQHSIGAKLDAVAIINPPGLEIAEATADAYASIGKASSKN